MLRKTLTLVLMLALVVTMFCSCGTTSENNDAVLMKIADNLYEVTYKDYDLDYTLQDRTDTLADLTVNDSAPGGCSAIREGNYVGRNLDLPYGNFADVIVHVPAAKGRYASVGSFCTLQEMTADRITKNDMNETLFNLIPLCVCDGINEKGVVCEMNVVPAKDVAMTTGTNPGKPVVNMGNVVRFVLDNASTAQEAIDLLKERNLCFPWDWAGATHKGWEYHYLIADPDATYVVEVINNELTVLDDEKTLTNYYLGIEKGTENGMGIERYEILNKNRSMATSVDGMNKLMQMVYWTKSNDINADCYCYSDHFGTTAKDGTTITLSNYENYKADLVEAGKNDAALTDEMLKTGENPYGLWITLHSCVFDIPARTMQFSIHECPDTTYEFKIEQQ